MLKVSFLLDAHGRLANFHSQLAVLVRKAACLSQEEGRYQFMISLQPSNDLPFPFSLTSKFRVSSTFFIPFLCATILSSFKPSSGLLVIISHREDSTSHLMKDEHASAVSCAQSLSAVQLLETPRTVVYQAPLFMGFSW